MEARVRVHRDDEWGPHVRETEVERGGLSAMLGREQPRARQQVQDFVQRIDGPVRRSVVDDEELAVSGIALARERPDRVRKAVPLIPSGDEHGDRRQSIYVRKLPGPAKKEAQDEMRREEPRHEGDERDEEPRGRCANY